MPNPISEPDQKKLDIAQQINELSKMPGYVNYLRPFLIALAQEGYPIPKEFDDEHKLMMSYINKCGETEAVKKILTYIESQPNVIEAIQKKYREGHMDEYKI
jgi:hypothetical protein